MDLIQIDVAVPNYNSPFLASTLDSILNQESGPFTLNIYVVDDCSDLGLKTNVQKSYEAKGIKFFDNKNNLGLVGNFNRCLELSTNEYLHILHADDMIASSFYKRICEKIKINPDLALIATSSQTFDGTSYIEQRKTDYNKQGIFEHLKFRNCLVASAVVVKAEIAKQIQFRNYAPHCCDWDMWARITANNPSRYITETLHTYRVHDSNDTANYSAVAVLEADLLLYKTLTADGIFKASESAKWKAGLVSSAKYISAKLLVKGKLFQSFKPLLFILRKVGFSYFVKAKLGIARVLLSKTKSSLSSTK